MFVCLDAKSFTLLKFTRCEEFYSFKIFRGFPGGTVVKNPPANAGGRGFEPWSGKIPHAVEQLSPCATTTEPAL